jgi:hypothetical protein
VQIVHLKQVYCSIFSKVNRTIVVALLFVPYTNCLSAMAIEPAPISGWTHPSAGSQVPGVNLDGGTIGYSSPVIAEIDGDLNDGKEVAVGTNSGTVSVYHANGTLLWSVAIPQIGGECSHGAISSSPAVGALFGDGQPYVVVGYGGFSKRCDGGIAAIRGSDGQIAWQFSTLQFSKSEHFWTMLNSVFSSPALADVDGDGKMEIGFGSFDRYVYLLNFDGSVRWYYQAADSVWSSPAFANVDQNPDLEMIIGTDISGNKAIRPPTKNGGYLYAFKTRTRTTKLIRFRDPSAFVWMTHFDQTIYSSPVIADVLPNNPGKEVVIGSGCFFPQQKRVKGGRWQKILSLATGHLLRTLVTTGCSPSSAAIADLNGDGQLDVIATVNGNSTIGGDGLGRVMAWNPVSGNLIWSVVPRVRGHNDSWLGQFSSPVVADIDGDGYLEVIVSNTDGLSILNGRDGSELTCNSSSCLNSSLNVRASGSLRATPAVADLNNDGIPDIVVGSSRLFAWTQFSNVMAARLGSGQPPYALPWPMFRGNSQHTAVAN